MIRFRKAVLIIHGFAGGTYDQEYLANHLELNAKLDVYNFTLPGHDVKSREKATCASWIEESERQLKFLIDHGYKKIYLVGHSMGGVIACYLATKYKEIKKIVLAAPAFTHLASEKEGGILGAIRKSPEIIKSYSTDEFFTRVRKLPMTAVKEFFKLIEKYQDTPEEIKIPVMILHGTKDQIVPITSSEDIFEIIPSKHKYFVKIEDYYHDLFKGKKVYDLSEEIENFLIKPSFMIKTKNKEM